jgi:exodeoxyribonuclease-3
MKLASWNVNSLRVRLPHVIEWITNNSPDVLALQETKIADPDFPVTPFNDAGYQVVFNGQKTYNGVAFISKSKATHCVTDLSGYLDPQRRILAASFDEHRIINLYVPNGSEVGSEKYAYKLAWLNHVHQFISNEITKYQKLAVLGDFNITPDDRDVYDPEAWRDKILCSPPEREALQTLLDLGLHDSFRLFDQEEKSFSWWDYRAAGFRRNLGLRIDLILLSSALRDTCKYSVIDKEPRKLGRPSDHAPVMVEF